MSPNSREESIDGNRNHQAAHGVDHPLKDDNFFSSSSWHNLEEATGDRSTHSIDDRLVRSGDDSDGSESTNGKGVNSKEFTSHEGDAIWVPPEAADKEDETESLGRYVDDDDDEYGDGIKWGQSSFSTAGEECEASPNPREERQKAMLEAMNGQLRILGSRFLASAGISFPKGEGGESWLDVVTSLSWEAALLIKPDGSMGKEMDPGSYIKVKCIASGTRQQCEVIKGLVFKKNAAHKHMPTKYHNPRLLLLKGVLGHSDVGLSSFNSMEQEKDHLEKAISKMMEICNPNVIMVEKTVSRDIQELLLKEGVTLVLDMKLNRLERIARCTGSPIISFSEVLNKPKLKQCDYFHIEKLIEEHNHTGGGGKRPSKTLLFLEGFPKPLGCTILLRGENSEELKKVKQVMHYTVFAAYHLILETSFFEDQRVFLNNKNASKEENSVTTKAEPSEIDYEAAAPSNGSMTGSPANNDAPELKLYPATSNGSLTEYADGKTAVNPSTKPDALKSLTNSFSNERTDGTITIYDSKLPLPSERLPLSDSGSLGRFIDMFRHQNIYLPVTSSQEKTDHQKGHRLEISQEMASNGFHNGAKVGVPVEGGENMGHSSDPQKQGSVKGSQEMTQIDPSLGEKPVDSPIPLGNGEQHSSSCISKEKITGKDDADDVLDSQSILILMSSQCIPKQAICEQSHLYRIKYYGDFDVSLGRYLRNILQNLNLSCSSCGEPSEAQMYSYTHRNGNLTVLVKRLPPQHRLPGESEGKIWMWTRCLRCEHESGVSKSSRRVLISTEARNLSFGKFLELSFSSHSAARRLSICGHLVNRDCLRFFGLGSKVAMFRYSSVDIYTACKPQQKLEFHNPIRQDWFEEEGRNVLARGLTLFSEVASLLQNLKNQCPEVAINYSALHPVEEFSHLEEMMIKEKGEFEVSLAKAVHRGGIPSTSHELLDLNWLYQDFLLELYVWDRRLHQLLECKSAGKESITNEIKQENVDFACDQSTTVVEETDTAECTSGEASVQNGSVETGKFSEPGNNEYAANMADDSLGGRHSEDYKNPKDPSFEVSNSLDVQGSWPVAHSVYMKQETSCISQQCRSYEWDDGERWIWNPFYELRLTYRKDLQLGCFDKFELINHYSPVHLSPLNEQSTEEVGSPQFVVGPGGNVLSVSEDEISSIISCAVAISEEHRHSIDAVVENEAGDTKVERAKTMEKSYSLISEGSSASSSWSSYGSSDSETSSPWDDLSSFDSSLLLSSQHPEISVNEKVAFKGKYSVICIHAIQFYNLRKKCCPSELAYIASLSRCKKWDAQGGKSKALFAKTLDDRFIIKQIKKTEFDSFIKFASDYFKHVYHALDTGSQTCLAKILGIYQVKQIRHGKEVKIDLMVMENLLFGHNISRIYDLKGTVFSRHISDSNDHDAVYLDQNFVEDMRVSPIYIGARTKHLLQRAIWNDTSVLTSINVMDYSLLVGVDKQKHELVFGIIDYLRQYTWDKHLETWVKISLVVPKNVSPTVISPKEYKKRFRKFMTKYFLTVPDAWSSESFSGPCKSLGHSNSKLSEINDEKPP